MNDTDNALKTIQHAVNGAWNLVEAIAPELKQTVMDSAEKYLADLKDLSKDESFRYAADTPGPGLLISAEALHAKEGHPDYIYSRRTTSRETIQWPPTGWVVNPFMGGGGLISTYFTNTCYYMKRK